MASGDPKGDVGVAVQRAMDAADEYMSSWNARDQEGMAAALNYPHIRIAGGSVRIWETSDDAIVPGLWEYMEESEGWHHSRWDRREVVHAGPDKVHLDVQLRR